MRRKNILQHVVTALTAMSAPVSFSQVEMDYVPPLDSGVFNSDPAALFASVRWATDAESDPNTDEDDPGGWSGTLVIDLVNRSGYDSRALMVSTVNDAVDAIVGLFMSDPDLGGHCVNAWCSSVNEKPTDVSTEWVVKTCQILVTVQSAPEPLDVEE